jgi:hypothetical protein
MGGVNALAERQQIQLSASIGDRQDKPGVPSQCLSRNLVQALVYRPPELCTPLPHIRRTGSRYWEISS